MTNWFKRYLTAARMMSIDKALEILGIATNDVRGKSADDVSQIAKRQRNRLALQYHPDHAKTPEQKVEFNQRMKDINNAFDTLKASGFNISGGGGHTPSGFGDIWEDIWDVMNRAAKESRERAERARREQCDRDRWRPPPGTSRPPPGTGRPPPRPGPRPRPSTGPQPTEDVDWEGMKSRMKIPTPPPMQPETEKVRSTTEDRQRDWDRREHAARESGKVPPWAVEWDAPHFKPGEDRSDARYCQKEIYEDSIKTGEVETFSIWEFVETEDPLRGFQGQFTNLLRAKTNWDSIFRAIKIAEEYFKANSHARRGEMVTPSILVEPTEYNMVTPKRDEMYLVQVDGQPVNIRFTVGHEGNKGLINQISEAIRKIKGEV